MDKPLKVIADITTTACGGGGNRRSADPARPVARSRVGKKTKIPIMTVLEEIYKMGPGSSSSHTMGPMRITYDSKTSEGGLAVSVVLC